MHFQFLGTSAGEQFPGLWCQCPTCAKARALGGRNIRSNSCAFLSPDCLLDIGVEAFQQARERFQQSHEQYHSELYRSDKIDWKRGKGPQIKDPEWFNPEDLPRFHMVEESLGDSFNAASFDLLLLIVFNVLFFMLAFVFFLRYDVT